VIADPEGFRRFLLAMTPRERETFRAWRGFVRSAHYDRAQGAWPAGGPGARVQPFALSGVRIADLVGPPLAGYAGQRGPRSTDQRDVDEMTGLGGFTADPSYHDDDGLQPA
jgi:hypothetical protein